MRAQRPLPHSAGRKERTLKDLQVLAGVGPSIAHDLYELGYRSVADLSNEDPERMYAKHTEQKGTYVDRCVLYVFRCAVYASRTRKPDPQLLLWWKWKDRPLSPLRKRKIRR